MNAARNAPVGTCSVRKRSLRVVVDRHLMASSIPSSGLVVTVVETAFNIDRAGSKAFHRTPSDVFGSPPLQFFRVFSNMF